DALPLQRRPAQARLLACRFERPVQRGFKTRVGHGRAVNIETERLDELAQLVVRVHAVLNKGDPFHMPMSAHELDNALPQRAAEIEDADSEGLQLWTPPLRQKAYALQMPLASEHSQRVFGIASRRHPRDPAVRIRRSRFARCLRAYGLSVPGRHVAAGNPLAPWIHPCLGHFNSHPASGNRAQASTWDLL